MKGDILVALRDFPPKSLPRPAPQRKINRRTLALALAIRHEHQKRNPERDQKIEEEHESNDQRLIHALSLNIVRDLPRPFANRKKIFARITDTPFMGVFIMSFSAALTLFVEEYNSVRNQPFSGHAIGEFIRKEFPNLLYSHVSNDRYKIKGSVGQGNWVRVPWVAILDTLVTKSAQDGFYIVYLLKEDGSGVYISLNQGVTTIRERYRADAKTALRARAENYIAQIGAVPSGFTEGPIEISSKRDSSLGSLYEFGAIFSKFYPRESIPNDADLVTDLGALISIYLRLVEKDAPPSKSVEKEDDELYYEDLTKIRHHKRIERNQLLAKKVKKIKGYSCEACGFRFKDKYRTVGDSYIEAHHLVPLAELEGGKIPMDPLKDFAVLCSNCHRMIHKTAHSHDIEAFKSLLI